MARELKLCKWDSNACDAAVSWSQCSGGASLHVREANSAIANQLVDGSVFFAFLSLLSCLVELVVLLGVCL